MVEKDKEEESGKEDDDVDVDDSPEEARGGI